MSGALVSTEPAFPVRDTVQPGESGQGYVLRLATANGLRGLPVVKSGLGRSRFQTLDGDDAARLSKWFGASEEVLLMALGHISRGASGEGFSYAGQEIGRSYFLNRGHPRVCPQCLTQDGFCRVEWDFSLVVACPHHSCHLADRCAMCGSALDWNRPGLMACRCGIDIRGWPTQSLTPIALERFFAQWVAEAMSFGADVRAPLDRVDPAPFGLLRLLRPLSLGAGLSLTYALASLTQHPKSGAVPIARKKTSMLYASQLINDAELLVQRILGGERIELKVSQRTVTLGLLFEAMSRARCPEDRSMAFSVLSFVLRQGGRTSWSSQYGQLSQMALFD